MSTASSEKEKPKRQRSKLQVALPYIALVSVFIGIMLPSFKKLNDLDERLLDLEKRIERLEKNLEALMEPLGR